MLLLSAPRPLTSLAHRNQSLMGNAARLSTLPVQSHTGIQVLDFISDTLKAGTGL
jgi:hypothetical protein